MQDIHPHWRSTEDPVPVNARKATPPAHGSTQISRRPAALLGISLVLMVTAFTFREYLPSLQGQVISGKTVHMTNDGFSPSPITVNYGETITFMNDSQIPQLIESDSLCSENGYCLFTSTLFPGESENFTITSEFPVGTYTYTSSFQGDTTGEIIVQGATPTSTPQTSQFQPLSSVIEDSIRGTGPFQTTTTTPSAPITTSAPGLPQNFLQNLPTTPAAVPQNPYAIGSDRAHPFDAKGDPIESAFENSSLHSGAPRPMSQPETGPGLMIFSVLCLSLLGVTIRFARTQEAVLHQL